MTTLRDYVYLGTTQSLCPRCLKLVPAKIISKEQRVYFRKTCPEHGTIEDFVCADVHAYDRHELDEPAKKPLALATESSKGCPYDCGLCPEHEQHTCVGLAEITSSCNLKCPMCFAESGPGGKHWTYEQFTTVVDNFVRQEGEPDVLQISGGEPTIHPEFLRMVRYAYSKPIQVVMINTNGIKLANDLELVRQLSSMRDRVEIYLQFDGFRDATYEALRGEKLTSVKIRALDNLAAHGIRTTLVCTVQHGVNLDELGEIVRFGLARPWVRGASFQPATYTGRHTNPKDLENRATIPDVVKAIVDQTGGLFTPEDFLPIPCAHPNCHMMTYVWRGDGEFVPVTRVLNLRDNADLVANTLVYTPQKARAIVAAYLQRDNGLCGPGSGCCGPGEAPVRIGGKFLETALAEKLTGAEMFRITLTAFLDKHTFDTRRVMKCCIAHLLPSGHTVPFCAYNTLYRDGTVPLPPLKT